MAQAASAFATASSEKKRRWRPTTWSVASRWWCCGKCRSRPRWSRRQEFRHSGDALLHPHPRRLSVENPLLEERRRQPELGAARADPPRAMADGRRSQDAPRHSDRRSRGRREQQSRRKRPSTNSIPASRPTSSRPSFTTGRRIPGPRPASASRSNPDNSPSSGPRVTEPVGRIHFAGAYCANISAGQEAALESGHRAANEIDQA